MSSIALFVNYGWKVEVSQGALAVLSNLSAKSEEAQPEMYIIILWFFALCKQESDFHLVWPVVPTGPHGKNWRSPPVPRDGPVLWKGFGHLLRKYYGNIIEYYGYYGNLLRILRKFYVLMNNIFVGRVPTEGV